MEHWHVKSIISICYVDFNSFLFNKKLNLISIINFDKHFYFSELVWSTISCWFLLKHDLLFEILEINLWNKWPVFLWNILFKRFAASFLLLFSKKQPLKYPKEIQKNAKRYKSPSIQYNLFFQLTPYTRCNVNRWSTTI